MIVFLSVLLLTKLYVGFSRKIGIGQLIKKEGPDLHGYKEGTPTMGGIVFVAISVAAMILKRTNTFIVLSTISFFVIGLLDDLSSILKRDAYGMSAKMKFLLQIAASILLVSLFKMDTYFDAFGLKLNLGYLYPIFAVFLLTGVSNAVNLTDGLDGLAGWVFLSGVIPMYFLTHERSILIISSAILGFLVHNSKPASIFMGDCGALALGAYLSAVSIVYKVELFLIFFGFIFMIETVSVMIQVLSYKIRRKRVFKMAPIHHHFELSGWSEEKIVFVFTAVNFAVSLSVLGAIP